jgi:hypothetical protein
MVAASAWPAPPLLPAAAARARVRKAAAESLGLAPRRRHSGRRAGAGAAPSGGILDGSRSGREGQCGGRRPAQRRRQVSALSVVASHNLSPAILGVEGLRVQGEGECGCTDEPLCAAHNAVRRRSARASAAAALELPPLRRVPATISGLCPPASLQPAPQSDRQTSRTHAPQACKPSPPLLFSDATAGGDGPTAHAWACPWRAAPGCTTGSGRGRTSCPGGLSATPSSLPLRRARRQTRRPGRPWTRPRRGPGFDSLAPLWVHPLAALLVNSPLGVVLLPALILSKPAGQQHTHP